MSLTVATVNVNGIRAAAKVRNENNHGILPWLEQTPADVVLLQEVRANPEQTTTALAPALESGWNLVQAEAAAKGRAGVAILSRHEISDVTIGFGDHDAAGEFADAGRYIEATTAGTRVASVYLPSGAEGTAKQDEKFRFLDIFGPYLTDRAAEYDATGGMVVGGDWNICHRRADLKNWRPNRKKSGFLPDERAFMDSLLGTFPDATTQVGDATDAGRNGNPAGAAGDFHGAVVRCAASAERRCRGGAVLLVDVAWQGLRHRRRLADRLPDRDRFPHGPGRDRLGGQGPRLRPAVERPLSGAGGVQLSGISPRRPPDG